MTLARRKLLQLVGLLGAPTVFLLVFFFGPLLIMLVYSFLTPGLYGGVDWIFSHLNYGRILGWADTRYEKFDPVFIAIFLRSLRLAALTVLASLLVCYPAAFWISRMRPGMRDFAIFLVTLPFFVSLIVRLFAWVLILRPTGFLNQGLMGLGLTGAPIEFLYTDFAVILGMTYVFIPFMFLPLYGSIEKLDMAQIEASSDLGATRFQTFRKVILPATLPGIVGGSVITFIPALGNFIVPSVLGGAKVLMIGNLIEQQFLSARNWPFGSALAMLVMSAVLILLIAQFRLSKKEAQA
ncbi:ABC transporter permease [Alloyangia pacifica]|uniref:Spermidine/putrescine transport system permease protein n=1 Tax=Alloyangia pacifica TaxID=311180 RepID=A0A1I6VVN4_9RHOB|nr:ABC transporter permease [Alloyangia pacifica]SDI23659.1 spermidine/putrescine transport system permease protein [Alloyangia pacifica]SFT17786.1 spermidine/putrescine transport system permease protein [Alloyangia pacifica]